MESDGEKRRVTRKERTRVEEFGVGGSMARQICGTSPQKENGMLEDRDAILRVMVTEGKQGNARGELSQLLAEGRPRR